MAFILFSDSLLNTTYNVQNDMFGLLHTTDLLNENISDLSLLISIILFIIDKLVKGINIQEVVLWAIYIAYVSVCKPCLFS